MRRSIDWKTLETSKPVIMMIVCKRNCNGTRQGFGPLVFSLIFVSKERFLLLVLSFSFTKLYYWIIFKEKKKRFFHCIGVVWSCYIWRFKIVTSIIFINKRCLVCPLATFGINLNFYFKFLGKFISSHPAIKDYNVVT